MSVDVRFDKTRNQEALEKLNLTQAQLTSTDLSNYPSRTLTRDMFTLPEGAAVTAINYAKTDATTGDAAHNNVV